MDNYLNKIHFIGKYLTLVSYNHKITMCNVHKVILHRVRIEKNNT